MNESAQLLSRYLTQTLTFLNFFTSIPVWVWILLSPVLLVIFLKVSSMIYNLVFSTDLNLSDGNIKGACIVPNQLMQKEHNESKNLCPTCAKQDVCQDYKILKYSDDCDSYLDNKKHILIEKKTVSTYSTVPLEIKVSIDLETRLTNDLQTLKFDKGTRTLDSLKTEINEVKDIFKNSKVMNNSFVDIDKTKKITEDIYDKGLNFLSLALDIYKQTNTNCDELKAETEELQENLNKNSNPESSTYKVLKLAVENNNKVLELVKKNKDKIDELFAQISLCKDAIMEIRLGLPELLNHQSTDEVSGLINKSHDMIDFGQRVLSEFKSQGL